MNLEPQQEAPRRREQIKTTEPTAAQLQARAESTMQELRETFSRDKGELAEAGISDPKIDESEREAEEAYQTLQEAIHEAEQESQTEAEPFDEGEIAGRVNDIFSLSPVPFSDLETLRTEGITNREKSRVIKEAFVARLGERYAEKILNPEYTRKLEELQTFLENGIDGMEEALLFNTDELAMNYLIAVHETLGTPEAITKYIKVLDLKQELPELAYTNSEPIIQMMRADFEQDSGELDANIAIGLWYDDHSHLIRSFDHKPIVREEGEVSAVRSVKHEVFNINPELHNQGLAKRLMKNSLEWYLDQNKQNPDKPIADIKLEANIDVGGYAWASYGFDWDKEAMTREKINNYIQLTKSRVEIIVKHVRDAGLTEDEERSIQEMISAYDQALENPDITPQELALIGKDGPFFRKDASRNWFTERQFGLEEREASEDFPTAIHAGKYGMLGAGTKEIPHRWHGTVELTPNGKQGGKNLALLQKRIT